MSQHVGLLEHWGAVGTASSMQHIFHLSVVKLSLKFRYVHCAASTFTVQTTEQAYDRDGIHAA
jgi:hypothetical protein